MRINPHLTLRTVANEHLVLLLGRKPGEESKIMALNSSSCLLWENLYGKEFVEDDVVRLLTENYAVDEAQAQADAQKWIASMRQHNVIEEQA